MVKYYKIALGVALSLIIFFWLKGFLVKKELDAQKEKYRVELIRSSELEKIADGYYQKVVADTLTQKELKRLAEELIDLKNRKPVSITKTVVQPVEIRKEVDSISIQKDSIFIADYYPNKINPFLTYTNRLSLNTETGVSNFNFNQITLSTVVTQKKDGLYQVDFKGPEFLKLKSLDIQTEPTETTSKDNWGTLIGVEYGQNLKNNTNIFEANIYQRYKKFYIGGSVSTNKDLKGGIKFEF